VEKQPLVSVIMPCYNMERFIVETILSVRQQNHSNWELIIVDDASTDGTADLVKNLSQQDSRIHLSVKSEHSGIADTRNQCLNQAKGRILAFLDADDVWHPEKLEHQLAFMQGKDIGFSYTSYDCIDEDSKPLNKIIEAKVDLNYEAYLRNTIIGCSTVMLDIDKVGPVHVPAFRTSEDTATWLTLMKKGFLAYAIQEPLTSYRIRKKSASSNKLKAAADLWSVYRKNEMLPFVKAAACFVSYAYHAIKKHLR
jgi:teichuronic acid biosynthesis glycosyltransferase TuaG